MSRRACGLCRRDPAEGWAGISDKNGTTFYCHGDDDPPERMTCYERAQSEHPFVREEQQS